VSSERFLDREQRLGRRDLILPVYYVNCPSRQTGEYHRQQTVRRLAGIALRAIYLVPNWKDHCKAG
jgi:hypothetical protein